MAITASDALYAQQDPAKLAKLIGKGVTTDDVFYMKQNPYAVANKVGISKDTVFYAQEGSNEFAQAVNKVLASSTDSKDTEETKKDN